MLDVFSTSFNFLFTVKTLVDKNSVLFFVFAKISTCRLDCQPNVQRNHPLEINKSVTRLRSKKKIFNFLRYDRFTESTDIN